MTLQVAGLFIYPVKACAGIAVDRAEIGQHGFANDRRWMIVDESGRAITQRDVPRFALIEPTLAADGQLILKAPQMPDLYISVAAATSSAVSQVFVWKDTCDAIDLGSEAAEWLTTYAGRLCRLVAMSYKHSRLTKPVISMDGQANVSFTDCYPFLVISQESLRDLNCRLGSPLLMNRFRPNIVVSGAQPYDEDNWLEATIGTMKLFGAKTCGRCVVTTIEQETATRGTEPLRTLAIYRKVGGDVMFGQYMAHANEGAIAVGDLVTVVLRKSADSAFRNLTN